MLAIKLSKIGKKHQPYFRVIVLEKSKDPWGDFKENLGSYNPRTKEINLEAERVKYWLGQGAQPSSTVHNLFVSQGLMDANKVKVSRISKKRQEKLNEKAKEAKKAEAEAAEKAKAAEEVTPAETEQKPEEIPTEEAK